MARRREGSLGFPLRLMLCYVPTCEVARSAQKRIERDECCIRAIKHLCCSSPCLVGSGELKTRSPLSVWCNPPLPRSQKQLAQKLARLTFSDLFALLLSTFLSPQFATSSSFLLPRLSIVQQQQAHYHGINVWAQHGYDDDDVGFDGHGSDRNGCGAYGILNW
jgi:hypothetical protein